MEPEPSFPSPSLSLTSRWWSKETVAIVTGANKGIGFAMVKRLAELGLTVILTARDSERGLAAVEELKAQGVGDRVNFLCALDVSDPASIKNFVAFFRTTFGALDILVNNAGVSFNEIEEKSSRVVLEQAVAETVINTNFCGPKLLTQALLPMFRRSSPNYVTRILNVSSRLGSLNKVRNSDIKRVLRSETLSEEDIDGVVSLFIENVKNGTWKTQGWPEYWTDYAVSKLALNAYSKVLAKRYQGRGLSVNCFCPGFTQTSMTKGKGTHTADDVACLGANLALLPHQHLPTAKFFLVSAPPLSPGIGRIIVSSNSKL
ncbi:(+)-neomenthol dehydrogenase [Quillaja saponaria]|uniref:(+)-neomenthol dehydrogenase n=1 Tax=Quillaja saponaria TaxID=32244 RepID=A0AAD7P9I6_QUISA|nr:(+)-neomenthol dehydrogenase [Quillaja saponaria]KAJ7947443.1 (+)-neomenthol dehydrogenase [Quillaja saponaria]